MKQQKGLPRGRPFKPGQSGNPWGRPPGARNKFTLAVEEGIERVEALAKEELARRTAEEQRKPKVLDKNLPFQVLDSCYIQFGRSFSKTTLQEIATGWPPPVPPERFVRGPHQLIMWKGRVCLLQNGFLFDYHSHLRIDP